jgi:hypothetical protein
MEAGAVEEVVGIVGDQPVVPPELERATVVVVVVDQTIPDLYNKLGFRLQRSRRKDWQI